MMRRKRYVNTWVPSLAVAAGILGAWHDALAACNVNGTLDAEVKVTHIKFDHKGGRKYTESGQDTETSDGLNILKGYGDDFGHRDYRDAGEWVLLPARNEPFLYVVDNEVTIKAKFSISPSLNVTLEIGATSVGTVFPDVTAKDVSFVGGVSVGDADGYVEFDLSGKSHQFDGDTSMDVAKSTDSWQWRVTGGAPDCELNVTGPHVNYCVLGVPEKPWYESTKTHPWSAALDIACGWADGETSIPGAVGKVTEGVYDSGVFIYDGAHHYLYVPMLGSRQVLLSDCIADLNAGSGSGAKDANCMDCANFVVSFGNVLGADYYNGYMGTGRESAKFTSTTVFPLGCSGWLSLNTKKDFRYHRVCWTGTCQESDKVFDACLKYDGDGDPWDANAVYPSTYVKELPVAVVFSDGSRDSPAVDYRETITEDLASWNKCLGKPLRKEKFDIK